MAYEVVVRGLGDPSRPKPDERILREHRWAQNANGRPSPTIIPSLAQHGTRTIEARHAPGPLGILVFFLGSLRNDRVGERAAIGLLAFRCNYRQRFSNYLDALAFLLHSALREDQEFIPSQLRM